MKDSSKEKVVDYELVLENSEFKNFFKIDNPKGKLSPGNISEIVITYSDQIIGKKHDIALLKNIGKWINLNGKLKLNGGYHLDSEPSSLVYDLKIIAFKNSFD